MNENGRKAARIFLPLVLYPILYLPYSALNKTVLVKKYGCGCPEIDAETGASVVRSINANTITWYFWLCIALLCIVLAAVIARRGTKKWSASAPESPDRAAGAWQIGGGWVCTACAVGTAVAALVLSLIFIRLQMWN